MKCIVAVGSALEYEEGTAKNDGFWVPLQSLKLEATYL